MARYSWKNPKFKGEKTKWKKKNWLVIPELNPENKESKCHQIVLSSISKAFVFPSCPSFFFHTTRFQQFVIKLPDLWKESYKRTQKMKCCKSYCQQFRSYVKELLEAYSLNTIRSFSNYKFNIFKISRQQCKKILSNLICINQIWCNSSIIIGYRLLKRRWRVVGRNSKWNWWYQCLHRSPSCWYRFTVPVGLKLPSHPLIPWPQY